MTLPSESQFRYGDGLSHADFNFQSFVPAFVDEVSETRLEEATAFCKNNSRCVFDYAVSGNRELAYETYLMEQENQERSNFTGKYNVRFSNLNTLDVYPKMDRRLSKA